MGPRRRKIIDIDLTLTWIPDCFMSTILYMLKYNRDMTEQPFHGHKSNEKE
jgi:hypothetical protein